ncbi:MAG: translation initiation factor IF-6 [Candidatus Altiarchaeales archaeon]|nr:translation initiation factor IF-6 [Candidatus Altiarchaeota archaeon]MBU4266163.1 translation initiation factor IF-6 [Candidatus Altiarchaeota archaeon]MBU4342331.1 translation initiation factor IF-6 [Candidatus Altiarchaeota archaeon]MBU4437065.1 translation initiation factor IF-6 [Candidatus Altiarchaeota archaeon]MCG2783049.1 translation initiation factor IF-6 [Candidatus Altiarchaeales archaeon]
MHLQQVSVSGEDFVGLLGFATDKYAILAEKFPGIEALGVPELRTRIYGTNLIGMFCCGNSNGILLPYFVLKSKIKELEKFFSKIDVKIGILPGKHTALGNLVACNDSGAVISPKISDPNLIEDVLGVKATVMEIAGHEEVGSCCIATNKGFLVHPDAEDDLKFLKRIFKVEGMAGSVNFGFPFVKAGLVANSNGYLTGLGTTGIELGRVDEAFGFLD